MSTNAGSTPDPKSATYINGHAAGVPSTRPIKPETLPLIPDGIPEIIRAVPAWMGWKWGLRTNKSTHEQKWTKVPIDLHDGGPGSSTNSHTWVSFDEAVDAYKKTYKDKYNKEFKCAGIGWAVTPGWVLIDLDGVLDKDGNLIDKQTLCDAGHPWPCAPADVLNRLKGFAYVERSVRGTGLHLIPMGNLPPNLKKGECKKDFEDVQGKLGHKTGYEMYDSGRFFTFTGHEYETSSDPRIATNRVKTLNNMLFQPEMKASTNGHHRPETKVRRVPNATTREIKRFFEDPDFMDQACKLTFTSSKALTVLQADDFKVRPGIACFNQHQRSVVANAAFEHFNKL